MEATAVVREQRRLGGEGGGPSAPHRTVEEGELYATFCHGLVEDTAFVHLSCSCKVHRRCALGFVEDAIPRDRANGARTLILQVMCSNLALHKVDQEVYLHTFL